MTYAIYACGNAGPFFAAASISKKKQIEVNLGVGNYLTGISLSPDKTRMAVSGAASPYLTIFDTATWMSVPRGLINPPNMTTDCAYSPDGAYLAVTFSASPYLIVYNTSDWTTVTLGGNPPAQANCCAFSPDGAYLAVGNSNSSPYLTVYNTSDWSKVTLTGGAAPGHVYDVAFSPDSSKLAVATASSPYITVYNTSDWSKATIPTGSRPTASAYSCAFKPDGSQLAIGYGASPYYSVLNTADWSKESVPDQGLSSYPRALKFSPDGKFLAIGINTGSALKLLNASDWSDAGNAFAVLPTTSIYDIAFNVGQRRVISGNVRDIDGTLVQRTVRAYERDTGELCAETVSDPVTGEYVLELYEGDVEYDIQFMALEAESLNDLFYARVTSGAV